LLLAALFGLSEVSEPTWLVITAVATAVIVMPLAARVGFRFGARRGVEAAIETMAHGSSQPAPPKVATRTSAPR
jgi:hypothetical protein